MTIKNGKLYIALISIHGLIRGKNLELGRDADTGGQTLYVLELAQALSRQAGVGKVDLITRAVKDDGVDLCYQVTEEKLTDKLRIVRVECGPDEYLPKEQLWDHLTTFSDNVTRLFFQQSHFPDLIHSHYADAGFVGTQIANQFGIPLVHTGHSLGRVKHSRLVTSGLSSEQVETHYNMTRRIEAEELTLATAERVITSTHQEIEEQYELYDHYQPDQMRVIPPGTDITRFLPPQGDESNSEEFSLLVEHLKHPEKPIILALSRPDKRKNIGMLIEAFGQSDKLQNIANLVIIAGNRDDIDDLDTGAQEVFLDLLVTIDRYNLYGKVAMPKHHQRDQVSMIYRVAANSGGVFVNPALTEPFGLTLIEAAASGLPIVATEDGGPQDIIGNCHNGFLIDPLEAEDIEHALLKLLTDYAVWQRCVENGLKGVKEHYAWDAHAERYLEVIKPVVDRSEQRVRHPLKRRKNLYSDRALVTDLDLNLIGDDDALQTLLQQLRQHRKSTKFAIITGRRLDTALRTMRKHKIPEPDVLITSGGTELYFPPELSVDTIWSKHIDYQWSPHKIIELLDGFDGLTKQTKSEQSRFKISYFIDPAIADIEEVKSQLHKEEHVVHVQVSFGQFLDILPIRASKGMALRYVADRWHIPLEQILVAGGSGADEDMMRGNTCAAVVANRHHEELSQLIDIEQIYFSSKPYAAGIMEAIEHYGFFNENLNIKEKQK